VEKINELQMREDDPSLRENPLLINFDTDGLRKKLNDYSKKWYCIKY